MTLSAPISVRPVKYAPASTRVRGPIATGPSMTT